MLLRQFESTGIPTLLVPRSRHCLSIHSKFANLSGLYLDEMLAEEDWAIDQLIKLASAQSCKPILFYGDDRILGLIQRHREALVNHFLIGLPNAELLQACSSKVQFDAISKLHGLPIPKSIVGDTTTSIDDIESTIGYPCIFKPDSHIGWFDSKAVKTASGMPQKVLMIRNRDECSQALENMRLFSSTFTIQELVRGGEENVFSFHSYVPFHNKIAASFVGQKIRTYPSFGGESSFVKLIEDDAILELGQKISKTLGIRGVAKLDLKRDVDSGNLYLMEINLRSNLWNYLGAEAGINLAEYAYYDLQGIDYTPPERLERFLRWINLSNDIKAFKKDYYPSRQLSFLKWCVSLIGRNRCSVYRTSDPKPFLKSISSRVALKLR